MYLGGLLFRTFRGILEEQSLAEKPADLEGRSHLLSMEKSPGPQVLRGEAFSLSSATDQLCKLGKS